MARETECTHHTQVICLLLVGMESPPQPALQRSWISKEGDDGQEHVPIISRMRLKEVMET